MRGTISLLCSEHQPSWKMDFRNCSGVGSLRSQRGIGGEQSGKTKTLGAETAKWSGRAIIGFSFSASVCLKLLGFFTSEKTGQIE